MARRKNYVPDFLIRVRDGRDEPLNLILEVTGEAKKGKGRQGGHCSNTLGTLGE